MEYINQYKMMIVEEDTKIPQFKLNNPQAVVDLMIDEYHMDSLPVEEVWALFTNVQNDIVGVHQVSRGGLASSICDPRSVFTPALLLNAAAIILVHNHPSKYTCPSNTDIDLTKKIFQGAQILGLGLLDHIIIGTKDLWYSFKESNELNY